MWEGPAFLSLSLRLTSVSEAPPIATPDQAALERLLAEIRACRRCVTAPDHRPLPHAPRPVLRAAVTAKLAVCAQAPGTRVHQSGVPFSDPSGVRLRSWMGVTPEEFYDTARVAIVPMGFCFPGKDAKGGDLPPRSECAPLWRAEVDRKSTRLNSSHLGISYAVFCLKKK